MIDQANCAFFTGLYNARSTEHAFDTMEERYTKMRAVRHPRFIFI